jgi:hypothetical protein
MKDLIEQYKNEIVKAYELEEVKSIFTVVYGKKFAKVLRDSSTHCFVNIENGNIYKAASWSKPADGVRGNVQNEKKPLLGHQFYNYR